MKTLLINPPQTISKGSLSARGGLPLSIMYVAAILDKMGYSVQILDTLIDQSPFKKEGDKVHVGMSWVKIKEEIARSRPDIVGISNISTAQLNNAIKVAHIVKEIGSEIPTVVGGPHPTVKPLELLEEAKSVDIVVIGEGEYTMLDIVRYYLKDADVHELSEIRGIAYRENNRIKLNPPRSPITNLDELPYPTYHLVDMEDYLKPSAHSVRMHVTQFVPEIPMITSRGCPFNCVFCSVQLHMGRKWRAHSKEYVVNHIEHVVNKWGVKHIHFEDDGLLVDKNRFEGILDELMVRGIKFTWDTPNGVRADGLTPNFLKKMKKSGCIGLAIGVESGDQNILDNIINKSLKLSDVIQVAHACKQLNINFSPYRSLSTFYIIGLPGEKKENIKKTLDFALDLKRKYGGNMCISLATPFFGTRLYDICVKKGYLAKELTPQAFAEAEP